MSGVSGLSLPAGKLKLETFPEREGVEQSFFGFCGLTILGFVWPDKSAKDQNVSFCYTKEF